jgi:hypothetical protein
VAKLLRLHLSCVGHKDARFFPLTLDFRSREGQPTDCVVWLMNGGGKSSLMNLFYSTFLPESRKFLGTQTEGGERRLIDYVKAGDLAIVVSEWQMPAGSNLFSTIRIVGQALAWKGGVATPNDESRLEREFFTFRCSPEMSLESLPLHGLSPQPCATLSKVKDWLVHVGSEYPELEVERGDQSNKRKWRETLDRVGIDTELFRYHLKMNVREGGAAELFKVRDTMEFVDLFLEMALNPDQADQTREQIEAVREKLLRLPQKELEDRFALALLEKLRPLSQEASAASRAELAWRDQRRSNFLLRSAIETSIQATRDSLAATISELVILGEQRENTVKQKLKRQEYRLNYHNFARELTFLEAKQAVESAWEKLDAALLAKNLAAAGLRLARISSRQRELDELNGTREAELAEQKPVLEELHLLGAAYAAALSVDLARLDEILKTATAALGEGTRAHDAAGKVLTDLRKQETETNSELENVKRRLAQRDHRRASLRQDGHVLSDEKAVDAVVRWENVRQRAETEVSAAEARVEEIDIELDEVGKQALHLDSRRNNSDQDALQKDRVWQRGDAGASLLRERGPIREVLATDSPDLDFPDLLALLHSRRHLLEEALIQSRIDRVDDERTLHNFDLERLFPPSREVELVLAYLRNLGMKTALPAYRFLATNATVNGTARLWLANEPARFSGIVVTSEEEFAALQTGGFVVPGLRHPVQVTLSGNADDSVLTNERTVALPGSDGAFNYETAASGQREIESRLERVDEHMTGILAQRQETFAVIQELSAWRAEFGGGNLDRLAGERDQVRAEVAVLAERLRELRTKEATLRAVRATKQHEAKQLRPQIVILAQRLERLRGYIEEYEKHEADWLEDRREKITGLEQLGGQVAAQEREVIRLANEIDSFRERVRVLKAERQKCDGQREAIRFRNGSLPAEPPNLETAETRYRNALDRYDERFGRSELDGRIKQAESHLIELREEHAELSGGLSPKDIMAASLNSDLVGQREKADRDHLRAHSLHEAAVSRLAQAERDRPEVRAHKQGLGLPPNEPIPATAADAIAHRETLDRAIETDTERIEALNTQITDQERQRQTLDARVGARTPHLVTLEDLVETSTGATPSLPTDDSLLSQLVVDVKRQTSILATAHERARSVVDERIEELKKVSRNSSFTSVPEIARDRLSTIPREELLLRCDEFIQSHEAWHKVLRNEIETLDKDKELVVRALDGVASAAVRLLGKAERASIMPEAFPGWTGQPFLRISAQPVIEPAARRDRLATLVTRLVNEKAIPTGHALASAALREIGGSIRATLLKPEDVLRPDRHDITEFGTFSGGEKMTAAVLLYVTLAQLRMRGRDERIRDIEAGILLLDNPFGTASKREFVELQLRVARKMGVQLIYTTGVNDLGALEVIPRILRLRKRHRDRRSGDLLLSQEPSEEHVEGVQANLRT